MLTEQHFLSKKRCDDKNNLQKEEEQQQKNENFFIKSQSQKEREEIINYLQEERNKKENKVEVREEHDNQSDSELNSEIDMFDTSTYTKKKEKENKMNDKLKLPLLDGVDNKEYYLPYKNQVLDERYRLIDILGKGVFSIVILVKDEANNDEEKVIKIMKNNNFIKISGEKEYSLLSRLNFCDKKKIYKIIRIEKSFLTSNGNFCIVFEKLGLSLRQILCLDKNKLGLSIDIIKSYARQILFSLSFIHSYGIIHTDSKYINIIYITIYIIIHI